MTHEHLTYDDLLRIVELIKSSEQFSEFRLKVGGIEVELRRGNAAGARVSTPAPSVATAVAAPPIAEPVPGADPSTKPAWPEGAHVIRSPMVGTFYRSPQPGAPPFVEVGQAVEPATIACIIEVMKLMNSIPAGVHGTVAQILVDDTAAVQAGQPLITVQPNSR